MQVAWPDLLISGSAFRGVSVGRFVGSPGRKLRPESGGLCGPSGADCFGAHLPGDRPIQVDRGGRDFFPKSGCPKIRISGPRRQSVARAYNFEEFGAGWLFGEGRWPKTGSGARRCWRPRRRRGLWAIWSPVGRHPAYFGSLVYQRTSRFRRHLPGAKAGRGRSSGGDLPADWPILGRPAELRSAGYLKNLGIRTSRRRVYGLSELRFSTSLSAAF